MSEDNIKIGVKEIEYECAYWIYLALNVDD
jgi:hypothetical protein